MDKIIKDRRFKKFLLKGLPKGYKNFRVFSQLTPCCTFGQTRLIQLGIPKSDTLISPYGRTSKQYLYTRCNCKIYFVHIDAKYFCEHLKKHKYIILIEEPKVTKRKN